MKILASLCGFIVQGFGSLACAWMEASFRTFLAQKSRSLLHQSSRLLETWLRDRKERSNISLSKRANKKNFANPTAEEHNDAIEDAVRKELREQLPQIV